MTATETFSPLTSPASASGTPDGTSTGSQSTAAAGPAPVPAGAELVVSDDEPNDGVGTRSETFERPPGEVS